VDVRGEIARKNCKLASLFTFVSFSSVLVSITLSNRCGQGANIRSLFAEYCTAVVNVAIAASSKEELTCSYN
jgi:hypothetical protein